MPRISRNPPREEFDESLTPNMTDLIFKPLGCNDQALKTKTSHNSFPNIGCEQLLVTQDLSEAMGIELEQATKHGEAIDRSKVRCAGSTTVEIKYQGQRAKV